MVAASWSAVRGRYPGPRCRGQSQDRARDGGRRGPGARPRRDRRRRRCPRRGVRRVVPRALVPDRPEAHAAADRSRNPDADRRERRRDRRDRDERVRRYTLLRPAQPVAHGGSPRAVDRDRHGGGDPADRDRGPGGVARRASRGRAVRDGVLLPRGRDRVHRGDRRTNEVPPRVAMRAAVIVIGIVAQMVSWWAISSGRVTVWRLMPFVLGAMALFALLVLPASERAIGVGRAVVVGLASGL